MSEEKNALEAVQQSDQFCLLPTEIQEQVSQTIADIADFQARHDNLDSLMTEPLNEEFDAKKLRERIAEPLEQEPLDGL